MKTNSTGLIYKALYPESPADYLSGSEYHRIAKQISRLRKALTFYQTSNNLSLTDDHCNQTLYYYLLKIYDDHMLPSTIKFNKFLRNCLPYDPKNLPYTYKRKSKPYKRRIPLEDMSYFFSFFSEDNEENILDSPEAFLLSSEQKNKIYELKASVNSESNPKFLFKQFILIMTEQYVD